MLDTDEFYDADETLNKTGTLTTFAKAPTSGDRNKSGRKLSFPMHTYPTDMRPPPPNLPTSLTLNTSESSESESDQGRNNHAAPG